jgi:hypothetical protein
MPAVLASLLPQLLSTLGASGAAGSAAGAAGSAAGSSGLLSKMGNMAMNKGIGMATDFIKSSIQEGREEARQFGNPTKFTGSGYKGGGNTAQTPQERIDSYKKNGWKNANLDAVNKGLVNTPSDTVHTQYLKDPAERMVAIKHKLEFGDGGKTGDNSFKRDSVNINNAAKNVKLGINSRINQDTIMNIVKRNDPETLKKMMPKEGFKGGGKTDQSKQPIVVHDPKDPRLKAYNDSTNLYNMHRARIKDVADYYNSNVDSVLRTFAEIGKPTKPNARELSVFHHYLALGKESKAAGIDPVAIYPPGEYPLTNEAVFKKPVQPVVYEAKPQPTAIPSIQAKVNESADDRQPISVNIPVQKERVTDSQTYSASKYLKAQGKPTGYLNTGLGEGREEVEQFKMGGKTGSKYETYAKKKLKSKNC